MVDFLLSPPMVLVYVTYPMFAALLCGVVWAEGAWGPVGGEAIADAIRKGGIGDIFWACVATFGPPLWPLLVLVPVALFLGYCVRSTALIGGAVVYRVRHESSRRLDRKREAGMLTIVDDAQTGGR